MACCMLVGNNDKEIVSSNEAIFNWTKIELGDDDYGGYDHRLKSVTFPDVCIPEHFKGNTVRVITSGYSGLCIDKICKVIDEHVVEII